VYFIALYMQRVLGFSEATTALALAPAPLTLVFTSTILTRRVIARFGVKSVLLAGLFVMCIGQLWLSRLTPSSDYVTHILPALMTTAFSIGLIFPAVSIGMTSNATPRERGLAGGLVPTSQQVGAAIGLAILATIAAASTSHHHGSLIAGYRASYLVAAVIVVVAMAIVAATSYREPATAQPAPH
jgi:MFS family permease